WRRRRLRSRVCHELGSAAGADGATMGGVLACLGLGRCSSRVVEMHGRALHVRRTLGEGGFSTVYEVLDSGTGSIVALKRVPCQEETQVSAEEGACLHRARPTDAARNGRAPQVQEALREAELCKLLDHPNVTKLVDSAVVPGARAGEQDVLVVLPYYPRGSLQDAIAAKSASHHAFSEREILGFIRGTSSACAPSSCSFVCVTVRVDSQASPRGSPRCTG
ncbi:MAG: hypothetical protein KIS78_31655, partial [Labilithrix sp.]|nr:hypothetical protein [Labilithrix sp.]